jgi:DNA-directed RNA polymerase subunit RPC12/RpoP
MPRDKIAAVDPPQHRWLYKCSYCILELLSNQTLDDDFPCPNKCSGKIIYKCLEVVTSKNAFLVPTSLNSG